MMTKLKPLPCPVCKMQPRITGHVFETGPVTFVFCIQSGTYTHHNICVEGRTESSTIKRWNRMVSK